MSDQQTPNLTLSNSDQALLDSYIKDYGIDKYYFDLVNRCNIFHEVIFLSETAAIAVYNGSNFKVIEVLTNNRDDTTSLREVIQRRDNAIYACRNIKSSTLLSKDAREALLDEQRNAVSNYRNWPNVS
ncbi:hypothetical protein L1267_23075 [Pseudoalteromonas sp. OFAV1]|uniref:hypothetical protein n=1 Tax=Pseudoalteromonas sp. OFAV1 TaxID=2908892 RepID=UPI001F44E42D|nr:hypothetical protein [Pseudoalteromonas sp. OFAV1]MCF2903255.1 hypothetical protein [Pseudoalteromonas sp. OFAV1]